jgi:hypothetical protein
LFEFVMVPLGDGDGFCPVGPHDHPPGGDDPPSEQPSAKRTGRAERVAREPRRRERMLRSGSRIGPTGNRSISGEFCAPALAPW